MTLAFVWRLIDNVAHWVGIAPAEDQVCNYFGYFAMPYHSARQETYKLGTPKVSYVKQVLLDCVYLSFKDFVTLFKFYTIGISF